MATKQQSIGVTGMELAGALGGQGRKVVDERLVVETSTFPLDARSDAGLSRTSEPLMAGTEVGRYEIVELVGSGGAGRVYRARDPELERFVALKLLHTHPLGEAAAMEAQARLLREARTLARLSHPNVVAAYDVGVHDGSLFMAMEFIDPVSMNDWLATPRTRAEIVRVLVAAGRGLAAAHAADVYHRDFKPANVVIASDGRARVVDFGLARTALVPAETREEVLDRESGVSIPGLAEKARVVGDTERLALSTSTALAGTPGFMAPEQLCGRAADARSDQFSYAVTAFLALTGAMPYAWPEPNSRTPLGERRAPWPANVPRRIRRVIARGLEPEPSRRYPSLGAMVSALEGAAAAPKHRAWSIAIGTVAASCLAVAVAVARQHERTQCEPDASPFTGVWDGERRSAVERAFQATGRSSQADAFMRISKRLDAFRDEWLRARRDACEASHVRGEQSERTLALRTACLDGALVGAQTLVDALGRVDAAGVDRVAGASPPGLRACSETSALTAPREPPPPERDAEIAEVERDLAGVSALIVGGFGPQAVERARGALQRARAARNAATIAKASFYLGRAIWSRALTNEERKEGETWVREGMRLAADSGHDYLLARTASYLYWQLSYVQLRIEESEAMLPMVHAIIERAGNPLEPRVEMLVGRGRIEIEHRRFADAIATLEEVRRLAPNAEGEVANFAFIVGRDLSQVRMELGQFAGAVQAARETVDGIRVAYGPGHPRMLFGLADLAVAQSRAGLRDPFQHSIAEARRIAATLPADEPRRKNVARAEGVGWENLGECERALPPLQEALPLFTATNGTAHPLTIGVLHHIATCLAATGRTAESIAAMEQVLANRRAHGAAPASIAETAFDLAKKLWSDPKQRTRALALIEEANSIWREEAATKPLDEAASWLATHAG